MKRVTETWTDHLLAYVQAGDAERKKLKITKASQRRIQELLALTIRVDQLLEMVMSSRNGWGPEGFNPIKEAIEDLNRRLAEYPSVIGVDYDPNFAREPRFSERVGAVFHPESEGVVARYIFHLAEDRLIQNFKTCLCGKLFYALREVDKSCSPKCRHKLYEQTPEFKKKRREKARENYRLHKEGLVKESNG